MRGRMTFGLLLSMAMLVGCAGNKQTAEQKRDAKMREEARKTQQKKDAQAKRDEEKAEKKRAADRRWEIGQHMFQHEDEPRLIDAFAQKSAADGALEDADFADAHFDGASLNTLGRSKLSLLLSAAKPNAPLTVYVAGDPALANARVAALTRGWKASKYADVQLTAKEGRNPAVSGPASAGLNALKKMDKPASGQSSSNASNAAQQLGDMLGMPKR